MRWLLQAGSGAVLRPSARSSRPGRYDGAAAGLLATRLFTGGALVTRDTGSFRGGGLRAFLRWLGLWPEPRRRLFEGFSHRQLSVLEGAARRELTFAGSQYGVFIKNLEEAR